MGACMRGVPGAEFPSASAPLTTVRRDDPPPASLTGFREAQVGTHVTRALKPSKGSAHVDGGITVQKSWKCS